MRRRAGQRYSLFKVGQIWHYRFQIDGCSVQRTTRQTSQPRAHQIAAEAFEAAQQVAQGKRLSPTIDDLAEQWLDARRFTASTSYRGSVETFRRLHLYDLAGQLVCDITTPMVEAALNAHLATHALDSGNHWLKILRMLTRWAIARKALPAMPWSVPLIKVQKRPRVVLPFSKTVAWLAALDQASRRDRSIGTAVRLMLGLGLREMEAAGARWAWLDWEHCRYTPGETKGREAVALPVPPWLMEYLRALPRHAGAEFIALSKKGRRHRSGYARQQMLRANRAVDTPGITPHRLRGTFATDLAEQGLPANVVQKLMRHKSITTTMGYLEDNMDLAVKAQEAIAQRKGM